MTGTTECYIVRYVDDCRGHLALVTYLMILRDRGVIMPRQSEDIVESEVMLGRWQNCGRVRECIWWQSSDIALGVH